MSVCVCVCVSVSVCLCVGGCAWGCTHPPKLKTGIPCFELLLT